MWRITIMIITTLSIVTPANANSLLRHRVSPEDVNVQPEPLRRWTFSPAERNLIRAHLIGHQPVQKLQNLESLTTGMKTNVANVKTLPQGWQKNVIPGRCLDYHAYRQGKRLPDILLRRLPPPPDGSEILRIGNKVVMLNSAAHIVLDAFDLTPTQ